METKLLRHLSLTIDEIHKTGVPGTDQLPDTNLLIQFCRLIEKLDMHESIPREHWTDYSKAKLQLSGWCGLPTGRGTSTKPWADLEIVRKAIAAAIAAPATPAESRFPNAKDKELANILERDLREAESCLEQGLWKSCAVLCGSILESALYEYLRRSPAWAMDATKRKGVPRKKGGIIKDIRSTAEEEKWTLNDLIDFACMNRILDIGAEMLHEAIREPRNLIHPMVELRKDAAVDKNTANVCMAVLKQALDKLTAVPDPV